MCLFQNRFRLRRRRGRDLLSLLHCLANLAGSLHRGLKLPICYLFRPGALPGLPGSPDSARHRTDCAAGRKSHSSALGRLAQQLPAQQARCFTPEKLVHGSVCIGLDKFLRAFLCGICHSARNNPRQLASAFCYQIKDLIRNRAHADVHSGVSEHLADSGPLHGIAYRAMTKARESSGARALSLLCHVQHTTASRPGDLFNHQRRRAEQAEGKVFAHRLRQSIGQFLAIRETQPGLLESPVSFCADLSPHLIQRPGRARHVCGRSLHASHQILSPLKHSASRRGRTADGLVCNARGGTVRPVQNPVPGRQFGLVLHHLAGLGDFLRGVALFNQPLVCQFFHGSGQLLTPGIDVLSHHAVQLPDGSHQVPPPGALFFRAAFQPLIVCLEDRFIFGVRENKIHEARSVTGEPSRNRPIFCLGSQGRERTRKLRARQALVLHVSFRRLSLGSQLLNSLGYKRFRAFFIRFRLSFFSQVFDSLCNEGLFHLYLQ